jgi:replicative DNA helicase
LDRALGGMAAGNLLVLAGASAQGKTAIAIQIAEHVARGGEPVGICELEMSSSQIAQRLLAYHSRVSVQKQRRGELDQLVDWPRYTEAAADLSTLPIWLDDTPGQTLGDIRRVARRWVRRQGIKLLIVDHLLLMRGDRKNGRAVEVGDNINGLKSLGKELGIPVMVLTQLMKQRTDRDNPRPTLNDLRETGSIEEAADVVMFVFREEYYLARQEPTRRNEEAEDKFNARYERWREQLEQAYGLAEILIGKNRSGATRTVKTYWDAELTRFSDFAQSDRLPEGY